MSDLSASTETCSHQKLSSVHTILYKGSVMKCQNCGNELGQDEVFCGQCGAQQVAPAQPTEMMQAPAPRSGLLGGSYRSSSFSPSQPGQSFASEHAPAPGPSAIRQEPQQS